jgi:hypothetical protein
VQLEQVDALQPEVAQAQLGLLAQVLGPAQRLPPARALPGEAGLRRHHHAVGVRVQRLPDQQLGGERSVGVGGVDERDAELDRAAQHPHGAVGVGGVAPDAGPGQLHRAEAEPDDREVAAQPEGAARGGGDGAGHGRSEIRRVTGFRW